MLPYANEGTVWMASTKAFFPAASWTCPLDSERRQRHDFSNLLLEFKYAVERQDSMLMEYCECELERMYRERKATTRGGNRMP